MKLDDMKEKTAETAETASKASKGIKEVAIKSKGLVKSSQQSVLNVLDQDGNGQIDSTDIILMALKIPGIKINREES